MSQIRPVPKGRSQIKMKWKWKSISLKGAHEVISLREPVESRTLGN